jgi:hypothetical protein
VPIRLCPRVLCWGFVACLSVLFCSAAIVGRGDEAGREASSIGPDLLIVGPLRLQPASLRITGRRWPHSILVSGMTADGRIIDLTSVATFTTGNEQVAQVDPFGWAHAVASGTTTINVQAGGQSASLEVTVEVPDGPQPFSFRHDVMPALSKGGCNQGACHGYSLGKNGFKLSLRGGDEAADYPAITQEFLGRRINLNRPEASLLVTKPLGDVPHGGGVRIEPGDQLYTSLVGWIREGARSDLDSPVHVVGVSAYPEQIVFRPGMSQQLQLLATYSDGSVRDVTRLGIYTTNGELQAEVDNAGLVTAGANTGETSIVVRFERLFDVTGVVVLGDVQGFAPSEVPQDNLVDRAVIAKLNELKIAPSETCADAEFLRRAYLDLIGVQPKPDEVRAFLADGSPDKRARVVDRLFERPEFVDHWSLKWGDLLQNSRTTLSEEQVWAFREWIRSAVAANLPLDEFARRLLTATGGYQDDPATAFFQVSVDANDTLQRVTQVFCGVRMLCAKCHAHPFENWTQADYYGLAGFFNQVGFKQDPGKPTDGRAKRIVLNLGAGYAIHPRTGAPQPPRFLGGIEPALAANEDRRAAYAAWLTSAENPYFARSLANRIWSYFFHRGIIHPVDDLRQTNPPINPALLDALSADFAGGGFDARRLMRMIVLSRTYQRSSRPNALNANDEQNFSRALPRRLPAETLLDCLVQATGVPEAFNGAPEGFTAAQLPDPAVGSEFLSLFGKPQRAEACECERNDESNMLQALQFINGQSILSRVSNPGGRVTALVGQPLSNEQLIEELYLWALARVPTAEEMQVALSHLAGYGDRRAEAAQDLMWVLLNSKDFMFNY